MEMEWVERRVYPPYRNYRHQGNVFCKSFYYSLFNQYLTQEINLKLERKLLKKLFEKEEEKFNVSDCKLNWILMAKTLNGMEWNESSFNHNLTLESLQMQELKVLLIFYVIIDIFLSSSNYLPLALSLDGNSGSRPSRIPVRQNSNLSNSSSTAG